MSKYSPEELKEMALEVVEDANAEGLLAFQLILTLVTVLEVEPEVVWERIREFARG